jgi:hypothetical protein
MDAGMAVCTKRDQVLHGIVAGVAAKFFVVNLKIRHGAACLAAPTIMTQNLLEFRRRPDSGTRRRVPVELGS